MSRRRQPPDPRYAGIRVDANFFDDTLQPDERAAADELMILARGQQMMIAVPHTVRTELDHPNTPMETKRRAAELPYTLDTGMKNTSRLQLVQRIVQGNAERGKHRKDATHLYDSALWQCAFFVTCDKRLLRKDAAIANVIDDLWIMRPTELLALYRAHVAQDNRCGS